jgi:hypothetical protein
MFMSRLGASGNPILQLAGLILGVLVAIGAVLVGAVILSFIIGFAVLAGLVAFARLWWLRRRMQNASSGPSGPSGPSRKVPGDIVEVEYTIVKERTVDE